MQAFLHRMIQWATAKVDKNVTEETVKVSLLIAYFFCFVSDVLFMYVLFFCRCCFQILKIFLQFTKTSCPWWRSAYSRNLMRSMKLEPAFFIMYASSYYSLISLFSFMNCLLLMTVIMMSVYSHENKIGLDCLMSSTLRSSFGYFDLKKKKGEKNEERRYQISKLLLFHQFDIHPISPRLQTEPCRVGEAGACTWDGGTIIGVAWSRKSNNLRYFYYFLILGKKCEYLTKNCIFWVKYLHGSSLWRYFTSHNCSASTSMFISPVVMVLWVYYFSCWSKTRISMLQSSAKSAQVRLFVRPTTESKLMFHHSLWLESHLFATSLFICFGRRKLLNVRGNILQKLSNISFWICRSMDHICKQVFADKIGNDVSK